MFTNVLKSLRTPALVAAAGVFAASSANAALVDDPNDNETYTIQEIIDADGLIVGNKLFDSFEVVAIGSPPSNAPDADEIAVRPGFDSEGNVELEFIGGWAAGTGEIINTNITFRAAVLDALGFFQAVGLSMQSFAAFGDGQVNIAENIYFDEGESLPAIIPPFLNVFYDGNSGLFVLQDEGVIIAPGTQEIFVNKDIIVRDGEPVAPGISHLSRFTQTFYTGLVPEPSTALLFAGGALLLASRRRKA